MSERNSEYTLNGYTLSQCIEALRIARDMVSREPTLPFDYTHRMTALIANIGTLARDMALLDYLDACAEDVSHTLARPDLDAEYRWRIGTHITGGNRDPKHKPRMHVREVLRDLLDNKHRYPQARIVERVGVRGDKP